MPSGCVLLIRNKLVVELIISKTREQLPSKIIGRSMKLQGLIGGPGNGIIDAPAAEVLLRRTQPVCLSSTVPRAGFDGPDK